MLTLDEDHIYRQDGVIRPGFSQILESMGFPKNPFWTQDAREEGIAIHKWIAFLAMGGEPESEPDPRIALRVKSFRGFLVISGFKSVDAERSQFNERDGYACTPDIWGYLEGRRAVIEVKRSASMKRHCLQTAAQAEALRQNGFDVQDRYLLPLRADGGPAVQELHNDDEDYECWRTLVSAYWAKERYK